jgi:SAM-dependent methyltransferase
MTEFWENAFSKNKLMWGHEPTQSSRFVADHFKKLNLNEVLIPGIGYGRNAKPFIEHNMNITGIEISETAIKFAREKLNLQFPIYQGPVSQMPFDDKKYEGIFCYGLIYLLSVVARNKLISDCYNQLRPGGQMVFTVISKKAPMYAKGKKLGKDCYETQPNLSMFFYDSESIKHEFSPFGLVEYSEINEPITSNSSSTFPFYNVICKKELELRSNSDKAVEQLNNGDEEVIVGGTPSKSQINDIANALKNSKSIILRMGGCQIGDEGAKDIGHALKANKFLKELWLFNSKIGDDGAKAIGEGINSAEHLKLLCLNGNQIGDIGARAIAAAISNNIPLENLGLGQNKIGNDGAKSFSKALTSNKKLLKLNMFSNQLGDEAALAFIQSLKLNNSLKTLGLQNNSITEEVVKSSQIKNTGITSIIFD